MTIAAGVLVRALCCTDVGAFSSSRDRVQSQAEIQVLASHSLIAAIIPCAVAGRVLWDLAEGVSGTSAV